ncbi:hypothetical protein CHUAL_005181 [Chamberlinius hualienensis]
MGSSNTKSFKDNDDTFQIHEDYSGFAFTELSPELATLILLHVPDNDLVVNCQLVCKTWKQLIDNYGFWKRKALMKGVHYPKRLAETNFSAHTYRLIAIQNPFKRNLIFNPYGKEAFNGWEKPRTETTSENDTMLGWHSYSHRKRLEDSFRIEDPPVGADALDTVPELREVATSCFATSHYKCKKVQCIDLNKLGCTEEVMRFLKPSIYICDWYAARFDCGSYYWLTVSLLDKNKEEVDRFSFEDEEAQWTGCKWSKVEHTFTNIDRVRYITFNHAGKDSQFWAGHYGSKMTGSTVMLVCD